VAQAIFLQVAQVQAEQDFHSAVAVAVREPQALAQTQLATLVVMVEMAVAVVAQHPR
jgi:hypothetical protein